MKVMWLWLLLAFGAGSAVAAGDAADGADSQDAADVDPREWGIRNGCVRYSNIKRVNFTSNDSGIIELSGGRQALVTLRAACAGIRNEGYVHKPVNGQFCEGDLLRVIHYGYVCVVDSIRPMVATATP